MLMRGRQSDTHRKGILVQETTGNIWDFSCDVRCITTNGVKDHNECLVMGAGLALQAKQKFPRLAPLLGKWVQLYDNTPCYVPFANIVSFPTKHHWKDAADIQLIGDSAKALNLLAYLHGWETVACARPGCGLGGLVWDEVREILLKIWDDRFVIVEKVR